MRLLKTGNHQKFEHHAPHVLGLKMSPPLLSHTIGTAAHSYLAELRDGKLWIVVLPPDGFYRGEVCIPLTLPQDWGCTLRCQCSLGDCLDCQTPALPTALCQAICYSSPCQFSSSFRLMCSCARLRLHGRAIHSQRSLDNLANFSCQWHTSTVIPTLIAH